jgi:transcriptional regulator with XRE-family HTH domain
MEIAVLLKQYREKTKLSLRDFADKCDVSHSYISMLENKKNSKTGEPIVPTLTMLNKISKGMGMSVNELINICDDIPISIVQANKNAPGENNLTEGEIAWLELYRMMPDEQTRAILVNMVEQFTALSEDAQALVLRLLQRDTTN